MNDEGYLSGEQQREDGLCSQSGEALHVESDINGGLGLEGELVPSKARADDAKMDEVEKKSGFKKRSKSIEVLVDSDDDEPIGSLFKLKRPRNPKKFKSGSDVGKVEIRAESLMVKDEDSGEMDDTLASFRKKLKGPKTGKDGGSGSRKGKDSALNVAGLRSKQVKETPKCGCDGSDLPLDGGLEDRPKSRGKRSRLAVNQKKKGDHSEFDDGLDPPSSTSRSQGTSMQKQKEGVIAVVKSCNHSSDENLEDSLSVFVRKSQSGSVKKARSSSTRKQRGGTTASDAGLRLGADGGSEAVLSARIWGLCSAASASASKLPPEILKSEGEFNLTSGETPIDPAPVHQETVETQRSDDGPSQASTWIQEGSLSGPVQELVSIPEITEEAARSNDDRCNKSSEETSGISVLALPHSRSHSGSIADLEERSAILHDDEFGRQIKGTPEEPAVNHDGLNRRCDGASEDLLSGQVQEYCFASVQKLTEETCKFKNGLKPCLKGNPNDLVHDIFEISSSICASKQGDGIHGFVDDGLNGNNLSENHLSSIVSTPGEANPKLDGVLDEASNVQKTSAEAAGLNDALDWTSVGVSEVYHSNVSQTPCSASFTTPRKEILVPCLDDDQLNRMCEETCRENNLDSENTFKEIPEEMLSSVPCKSRAQETTRYDELVQPFGKILENSLTYPVPNSSPASIPVKMKESPKFEGGFDQSSDGSSENFQLKPSSVPCSMKKDETGSNLDASNQTPGTYVEDSRIASVPLQMGEISRSDDGLHPVLTSDVVKKSDFSSPMNHNEESTAAGDVSNCFSDEPHPIYSITSIQEHLAACPQNKPSDDVSKGTSAPCLDPLTDKEEVKVTCSQSITLDLKDTYPEDAGKSLDLETNDKKLLAMQRVVRKVKKHRHGDMAYEGDTDWEFLMHEQSFFENNLNVDADRLSRMKDKFDSLSSMATEADNGGAAAVAAGLKAHAVGPVEKIKFREVLKRRGGLLEYLEYRNLILGLWSKDMSRILPLVDCGVSDAPSEDEMPRASLIREIYAFLDHSGYINVGIASEKEKAEPFAKAHYKLLEETKTEENCGAQVADSEDGVAFILGRVKSSGNLSEAKNDKFFNDENPISEATKSKKLLMPSTGSELSTLIESEECMVDYDQENGLTGAKLPNRMVNLEALSTDPSSEVVDGGTDFVLAPENIKDSYRNQSTVIVERNDHTQCDSKVRKRILVIGAGPAGLTAARHLQRQGFSVMVLEARNRLGGRVYTDHSSLSVPVDLGASIITGVEADVATERRPDPSSLVCAQLGLELTILNSDCPLYDIVTGQKVPPDLDEALEAEYNSLLDDMVLLVAQKGERAMKMSLEDGLEYALKRRRMARLMSDAEEFEFGKSVNASFETGANGLDKKISYRTSSKEEILSPLERRVMDWHFANLEYGCAALLKAVSLPYWNQDDVYGGFGGAHCMIKGGYSTVVESLGKGLCIHLNHVVTEVSYCTRDSGDTGERQSKVKVSTLNGSEFVGDAVLITVPLGCLKADTIKFSPDLPEWKRSSIRRLGFGVLNKVVLEFPEVFWDDSVDYFGATAEETDRRGQCFMFWNIKKTVGAPVLIALVVGKAAIDGQSVSSSEHVSHALRVLRRLFGEASVPDPVASVVTNWGSDPFSRGAYSYVAVGASGEDYDLLGRPVENCLFFAGEATCKEHPDTVGGAMMSGLREAVRIIDILNTGYDYTAEVEAMEAAQRQTDSERNEVRDILKRLDAVELSNVLCKSSLDGDQMLTKDALLQDMFHNARTTAGRLHLAKELLNLPVDALKSFAGTKEGLGTLNSWILDSMGKDGTQLLRHCVRLLVLVSTDLLAVRLSGIGRTVKEKVCVHTSRDIRSVASQLVSMWIEVFRKEKAANGGLKLLRQTTAADSSKTKSSKDLTLGKPSIHTTHGAPYNRRNVQVSSSPGNNSPSNANNKKANCKPVKLETVTDSKSEVNSSRSQGVAVQSLDPKVEEENYVALSEEEAAAFAAAEAARAAALAAAEAYASSEAECGTLRELPKIPSFHKFARREQYAQMDDLDLRRRWSGGVFGRQDCISEIDSRNCRVRNWSVDFSAACANLDSSRMSGDNYTQQSYSNEVGYQLNLKEHSGESAAADSRLTKAWVDSPGSGGVKDYHAIERWQSQAAAVDSDFFHPTIHARDEEDSNTTSKLITGKYERRAEESSASQAAEDRVLAENQPRGADRIKKTVVDYVGSLLMPLYKARKIDKEGYKSIMKKSATKVMEQTTDAEKVMTVSEFLDFRRKNKIRSFVDKLIERHMAMNPVVKP